jgi:hypothetical protein
MPNQMNRSKNLSSASSVSALCARRQVASFRAAVTRNSTTVAAHGRPPRDAHLVFPTAAASQARGSSRAHVRPLGRSSGPGRVAHGRARLVRSRRATDTPPVGGPELELTLVGGRPVTSPVRSRRRWRFQE